MPFAERWNRKYRIRFIKGVNLSVCDPWGTSDPYVTVSSIKDVNGLPIKTKVIKVLSALLPVGHISDASPAHSEP